MILFVSMLRCVHISTSSLLFYLLVYLYPCLQFNSQELRTTISLDCIHNWFERWNSMLRAKLLQLSHVFPCICEMSSSTLVSSGWCQLWCHIACHFVFFIHFLGHPEWTSVWLRKHERLSGSWFQYSREKVTLFLFDDCIMHTSSSVLLTSKQSVLHSVLIQAIWLLF